MRTLLIATAAVVAMLGTAGAADLRPKPVYKAPPPPVVAAPFSWTGIYLGGHVGGVRSDGWASTFSPLPSAAYFKALPLAFTQAGSSTIAGGQIGANWQIASPLVVGIEADLSAAHIHTRSVDAALDLSGVPFTNLPDCPGAGNVCTAFMTRNLDRLGTVRGRLGFAWDHWLAFVTGGFAYGRVTYTANYTVCCQHPFADARDKTGSAVGGGLEFALPGELANWSIRGEYLHVRLGGESGVVHQQSPPDPANLEAAGYNWNNTKVHIARFALNYRFGWRGAPWPIIAAD